MIYTQNGDPRRRPQRAVAASDAESRHCKVCVDLVCTCWRRPLRVSIDGGCAIVTTLVAGLAFTYVCDGYCGGAATRSALATRVFMCAFACCCLVFPEASGETCRSCCQSRLLSFRRTPRVRVFFGCWCACVCHLCGCGCGCVVCACECQGKWALLLLLCHTLFPFSSFPVSAWNAVSPRRGRGLRVAAPPCQAQSRRVPDE